MKINQLLFLATALLVSPALGQQSSAQLPQRIRLAAGVMDGNLQHKVEPQAPLDEHGKPMHGSVLLRIIINKEGKVVRAEGERGKPALIDAAIEAVKQWTYEPFRLSDQPVEAETWVNVKIKSGHRASANP